MPPHDPQVAGLETALRAPHEHPGIIPGETTVSPPPYARRGEALPAAQRELVAMTEVVRRARLFLGSYVLLFVLLALRFHSLPLELTCGALAALGLGDMLWIVFGVSKRTAAEPVRVERVVDTGPEVAGYLATYLLPFLTVAEPTGRDVAAYGIFLVVTGIVYIRSEMAQINPTLYLLGCRVVRVGTDKGWNGHVVARSQVHPGQIIRVVPLNAQVRVEVKSRAEAA